MLESVLKKCPNIEEFILYSDVYTPVNSSVLSLIGRYCHRIKSLTFYGTIVGSDENVLSFFRDNGHKLEDLYCTAFPIFSHCNDEEILRLCPNVKKIHIEDMSVLSNDNKEFLPKLERIESNILISSENLNEMKILSVKYSQTIKSLDITLYELSAEELKTCIECIARFENLRELKLTFQDIKTTEPIDDCLSLIGQKLSKLLTFTLFIYRSTPISDRFLDIFIEYKAIKKLKIYFPHIRGLSGSVECFKHCKHLKHIDIGFKGLTEEFFANIELFVPKLRILFIKAYKLFSDSFINTFHSMKNIQNVNVIVDEKKTFVKKYYYFGKSLSEVMLSPEGKDVIEISDNCGLYQTRRVYGV